MELVSVLMPTFNTPNQYLECAVKSILVQTYSNFELIIVDDNSSEQHRIFLQEMAKKDSRIVILANNHTKGVAGALNTGLIAANGKYILRMDSDDVSEPKRIENQVLYLESHPNVSLVAGFAKCFGDSRALHKAPTDNERLRTELVFQGNIVHPTVCFRRQFFMENNLFYKEDVQNEDYELWMRAFFVKGFVFSTLKEVVLKYRVHNKQVTKKRIGLLKEQGLLLRQAFLKKLGVSDNDSRIFANFCLCSISKEEVQNLHPTKKRVLRAFLNSGYFTAQKHVKKFFWRACFKKSLSNFKKHGLFFLKSLFLDFFRCL